jgi:hypothetical protein
MAPSTFYRRRCRAAKARAGMTDKDLEAEEAVRCAQEKADEDAAQQSWQAQGGPADRILLIKVGDELIGRVAFV